MALQLESEHSNLAPSVQPGEPSGRGALHSGGHSADQQVGIGREKKVWLGVVSGWAALINCSHRFAKYPAILRVGGFLFS